MHAWLTSLVEQDFWMKQLI
uniref:Uncharacterized protein n=1 Tax=Rhizophora mucronata TaxID=61149 RepID=A0A2P2NEE9_RHIMU